MPRRRPARRETQPNHPPTGRLERVEVGPDGTDWHVRAVTAGRAVKTYRCPGCDHEVLPGTAHVLAWPGDEQGGAQERRHWHTGCWSGRGRRGLTRRWS